MNITDLKPVEDALGKSNRRLELLAETASQLLKSDSPQDVVDELCWKVMAFLDCDAFFNFLVDDEKKRLHLNSCGGIPEEDAQKLEWLDYGVGLCGRSARDGCRLVVDNLQDTQDQYTSLVRPFGIQAYACHPLISQGQVLGTLSFCTRTRTSFSEDELSLMKIVADHVAIAINRKRIEDELHRSHDELEKRVADRTHELNIQRIELELKNGKLRENEVKLHAIFNSNIIGIICFDILGNITFANDTFLNIVGYTREDLDVGLIRWTDITPPEFLHLSRMHIDEAMARGSCSPYEKQYIRKDGTRVWVLVGFLLKGERHDEGEAFVIDITDRKKAEEDALESQRKISTMTGNLPGMVYRCQNNQDWTMEFVSGGCLELTGYKCEDLIGNKAILYGDIICPEDRDAVWDKIQYALQARRPFEFSYRIKTAAGKIKWVWEKGVGVFSTENKLLALEGFISDITEHKQLEMQLLHAQKMEAIGILSGGIAHDFNNIINVIIGYASLIEEQIAEEDCGCLEQIMIAANRAAGLTKSLLAFSRKQVIELRPIQLNEVVQKIDKLLRILLREDIELVINLSDDDLLVMADIGQIEQVLVNLTTNAIDAMPNGGLVTISTAKRDIDRLFIQSHGYGEIGKYAVLAFSDTGCGMDEASRQKMFEPFFTTKEVGKGTGLGLSIAYGIIKQHNGFINCYSEPGKGSSFKIYLPLSSATQEQIETTTTITPQKGTETILLAEDDGQLRELSRKVLEEHGYSVIVTADGEDAIARFKDDYDKIRLAVLDVIMPNKNGKEVYDEIVKIKPEIKVLFMSGYAEDILNRNHILTEGLNFIAKPLHPMELLKKVRELLDGKDENSGYKI